MTHEPSGYMASVPTVSDVDTIGAIGDPVIRNLRITQCYHELAGAVAERVAPGANWCTFATWASRQAGQTIRGEDFARGAEDILGSHEVAQVITDIVRLSSRTAGTLTHDTVLEAVHLAVDPEARAGPSGGRRGRREPQGVRRDRARVRALAWHRRCVGRSQCRRYGRVRGRAAGRRAARRPAAAAGGVRRLRYCVPGA